MAGPVILEVKAKDGEGNDRVIKRFLKKFKKQKLMDEFHEHDYYVSPSEQRRKDKKRRKLVLKRLREAQEAQ